MKMKHVIYEEAEEILNISRWFIVSDPKRKRTAMRIGGVQMVANEVWLSMERFNPPDDIKLTTAVTNQTRWVLNRLCKKQMQLTVDPDAPVPDRPEQQIGISTHERQYWRERIETWLRGLTPRERAVIEMKYGIGGRSHSRTELAKAFAISKGGIDHIETRSLAKLRRSANRHGDASDWKEEQDAVLIQKKTERREAMSIASMNAYRDKLRDHFAGHVLAGSWEGRFPDDFVHTVTAERVAEAAYEIADAMMRQRDKPITEEKQ